MGGALLGLVARKPRLIVSLPRNCPALARAAAEAGADALKVHLHVTHEASGTQFGGLAEERGNLEDILSLGLPVGVVPGAAGCLPSEEEMRELAAMGLDFFDMFARTMPVWMMSLSGMTPVGAVDGGMNLESVSELEGLGIEMVEAAIVPPDGYGKPLSLVDLAEYRRLRRATGLPVIVPTERAIKPEEVPLLLGGIGINAVMIGAVVTGREAGPLKIATAQFASAIRAVAA